MSMLNVNTELIARAQKGDEQVIRALYEKYHLSVYRFLYYRVGDPDTAEDLTSETFLRMLRFLGGFRPPATRFTAWLFSIARNLANDHYRSTRGRETLPLEEEMPSPEGVDGAVERSLASERLRQALEKLGEDQRDVIVLRFIAGMPIVEVAQALNRSEDAIKGLQRRGLAALRELLADLEVSDE